MTIPLYLQVGVIGEMNIQPDLSYLDDGIEVLLEDLFTGDVTNLKEGTYTFTSDQHGLDKRFLLHFIESQEVTLSDDESIASNTVNVWSTNKTVYVNLEQTENTPTTVIVYDLFGKELYNSIQSNGNMLEINLNEFATGYYVVKVNNENQSLAEKVFIK